MSFTLPADTLACDTARIAFWQSDPAYGYNRELATQDLNLFEWLVERFEDLMRSLFGSRFAEEHSGLILAGIVVFLLLSAVWFIYKKHPRLFMSSRRQTQPCTVEEDTIYGVDFSERIAEALARRDYREAVRLLYLQTLKQLSDTGRIDWQPCKTPTQYIHEVGMPAFRQLTVHFLRVRYGNFEATETLFTVMQALQEEIGKGNAA